MLNAGRDTTGQLATIISALGDMARGDDGPDWSDPLPDPFRSLFSLTDYTCCDPQSLFTARDSGRRHRPAALALDRPAPEARRRATERRRQRLLARMTRERVDEFVHRRLGDRAQARAVDMGIATRQDVLCLIYAVAYAGSRRVNYEVVRDQGRSLYRAAGMSYPDVLFRRRRKGGGA